MAIGAVVVERQRRGGPARSSCSRSHRSPRTSAHGGVVRRPERSLVVARRSGTAVTTRACDFRLSMITSVRVETKSASGVGGATRRRVRQRLDVPHHVVAEEADRTSPEVTEFRHGHRVVRRRPRRAATRTDRSPSVAPCQPLRRRPVVHGVVPKTPGGARLGAQEGVARPRFAPGRCRLEQEGERTAPELRERRDRACRDRAGSRARPARGDRGRPRRERRR